MRSGCYRLPSPPARVVTRDHLRFRRVCTAWHSQRTARRRASVRRAREVWAFGAWIDPPRPSRRWLCIDDSLPFPRWEPGPVSSVGAVRAGRRRWAVCSIEGGFRPERESAWTRASQVFPVWPSDRPQLAREPERPRRATGSNVKRAEAKRAEAKRAEAKRAEAKRAAWRLALVFAPAQVPRLQVRRAERGSAR